MPEENTMLDDIKTLLEIDDEDKDNQLKLIIKKTRERLLNKLHLKKDEEIPFELEYIIFEVSIRRFNRVENEGMTSYSQDGESITFKDDDFSDFNKDIQDYLNENDDSSKPVASLTNPYARRVNDEV
ncbi:phage head-tail connector protein [Lactobacillus terrae]|uniref:phage head-tail connector protein n=1 Tax=Lactobacillus terrae TaxID=2269374 RepID=UPI001FE76FF9|nr:phage head-tail connector protein [Lactobacillus terrae]